MSGKKAVSLQDVALRAGVSTQTVSRVSNHSGQVSESTRAAVLKAMHETGYRPNYAARALRRGSFRTIGVAMFDIHATGNTYLLQSIAEAADARGYSLALQLIGTGSTHTLAEANRRMRERGVDAVIVFMERMVPDFRSFTPSPDLPAVILSSLPGSHLSTVDSDQEMGAKIATNYLLDHGHKMVWFVSGPSNSVSSTLREEGWRQALKDHGIAPPPIPQACRGDWTADSGYRAGLALAKIPDCTAVYAANDSIANGVIGALRDCGKKVPDDVSIIGEDDSLRFSTPHVILSSIQQDWEEVGRTAVDVAIEQLKRARAGEDVVPTRTLIPCRLIERSSVRQLG